MARTFLVISCRVLLAFWLFSHFIGYANAAEVLAHEFSGANLALGLYQKYISDLRYGNCRFNPSCSEYALQAVRRYGYLAGTALAADRLVRCNRDASKFYEKGSDGRLVDPVGRHETGAPENPKVTVAFLPILENALALPFDLAAHDSIEFDTATLERLEEYRTFGDFLAQGCDCERAATEYQRVAFLGGNSVLGVWAQMRIGACYFEHERWDLSATEFLKVATRKELSLRERRLAQLMAATSLFNNGQYLRCKKLLSIPRHKASVNTRGVRASEPMGLAGGEVDLAFGVTSLMALCQMGCGEWDDASVTLRSSVRDFSESSCEKKVLLLSAMARKGSGLPQRSSKLATTLSIVVPGLGQIYAGRTLDGLRHLVVDGLLLYGTFKLIHDKNYSGAYLLAGVTVPFYLGNVLGAGTAVKDSNRQERARFLSEEMRRIENQTEACRLAPK